MVSFPLFGGLWLSADAEFGLLEIAGRAASQRDPALAWALRRASAMGARIGRAETQWLSKKPEALRLSGWPPDKRRARDKSARNAFGVGLPHAVSESGIFGYWRRAIRHRGSDIISALVHGRQTIESRKRATRPIRPQSGSSS